jgi:hypothetical protein
MFILFFSFLFCFNVNEERKKEKDDVPKKKANKVAKFYIISLEVEEIMSAFLFKVNIDDFPGKYFSIPLGFV